MLTLAWVALVAAAVLSVGKQRLGGIASALGLGAVLLGTLYPGAGLPFFVLAMISAGVSGPQLRWPAGLLVIVALLGGGRSWRVQQVAMEASVDGVAALVDSHRADWLEDTVMNRLDEVRLIAPDASAVENSWVLSGRGAPRLALSVLGKTPDVGWQRAALLQQAGLTWAASAHSGASEPDDVVTGPGELFAVGRMKKNQVLEIPVVLRQPASELVLRANGEFLLGWPELRVQLGAIRQGPIQVPDEGGEWVWRGDWPAGPYVLRVSFENYFDNRHGKRQLTDVVIEAR